MIRTSCLLSLALLLGACASAPQSSAPPAPQKTSGWVEQYHYARGRPECLAASGNNEDAAYFRCINGWRERIWVEDLSAVPHPPALPN